MNKIFLEKISKQLNKKSKVDMIILAEDIRKSIRKATLSEPLTSEQEELLTAEMIRVITQIFKNFNIPY